MSLSIFLKILFSTPSTLPSAFGRSHTPLNTGEGRKAPAKNAPAKTAAKAKIEDSDETPFEGGAPAKKPAAKKPAAKK